MTPLQISALLGQWVGAAFCLGAIVVMAVGINIELKYKAARGLFWITVGSFLGLVGGTLFAIATKMLGF